MCVYIMFVLGKCQATPFHGRWDTGVCEGAINIDLPKDTGCCKTQSTDGDSRHTFMQSLRFQVGWSFAFIDFSRMPVLE